MHKQLLFDGCKPQCDLQGARLRHIAGTKWGSKKYLNMELLKEMKINKEYAA